MDRDRNLLHLFLAAAQRNPRAVCLYLHDGRTLAWEDLATRALHMAAALAEAGVAAGDRVLAQVDKSADAVALYLACLHRGAVYVPLNTAYTGGELDGFLSDAEPRVAVLRPAAAPAATGMVRRAGATLLTLGDDGSGSLAELAGNPHGHLPAAVPRGADDLAAILYTSGTTGRSKGAMLTHGNLASNALTLRDLWGWRDDDVLLHMLPVFHVHGLFVALHCALFSGTPVLFEPRFDVDRLVALLPRATVLMGVPTFYSRLLEHPGFTREVAAGVRLFISGSAPLTDAVSDAFAAHTGQRILERYGMSETGMITSNPLDGERVAGTVGYALPGVDVRVTGDDGAALPAGGVGGVEVRGPNVFRGYWRLPERTREEFTDDGWFRTGDLGALAADGRLTLVGRSKDLVISGGYNIYPKEVEQHLDALPGVRESAVVGVPHPDLGEAPVAAIVPLDGAVGLDTDAVRAALADALARFKQPKRVVLVDSLPRNAMGKVQKALLRELLADSFTAEDKA